jgi:hypothetical protein
VTVAGGGFRRFSVSGNTITPIGAITPFHAGGTPVGGASLDTDPSGGFVVAWGASQPSGEYDVRARRFDEDANPLTGDLEVNTTVAGSQIGADVGVAPDGDFVVGWVDQGDGASGGPTDIRLREFSSAGVARGSETAVSESGHRDTAPQVTYGANDRLAVAWVRGTYDFNANQWKQSGHIFARRFVSSPGQVNQSPIPISGGGGGGGGQGGGAALPGFAATLMTLPGSLTVNGNGNLRIVLSCPAQLDPTCDPLLQGTSVQQLALKAAARKRKKKPLKLGSRRYSIPQGTKKTVTFKLSKRALRYLKRKKSLKARFTLTTGNKKVVKTTTLKLKKRKR